MVVNIKKQGISSNLEADCPLSTSVGHFVYVTGPEVGGRLQVATVDVTNKSTMPAFGVVVRKDTPNRCVVMVRGEWSIPGGASPHSRYFINTSGGASVSPPSTSTGGIVVVQAVGYGLSTEKVRLTLETIPIVKVDK